MSTIQLKRSTTSGNVPASLAAGEFAINEADGLFFFRNPSAAVASLKLAEGERLIAKGTVTNAANLTLSVDPAVIGVFRAFRLFWTDWRPATSSQLLSVRLGDSSGIKSGGSDYVWGYAYASQANGSFYSSNADSADSEITVSDVMDTTTSIPAIGMMWISGNDPAATIQNFVLFATGSVYNFSGNYPFTSHGGGAKAAAIALTQIQLFHVGGGNIATGKYVLFGIP